MSQGNAAVVKRVVVLGHSGFIGTHLMEEFRKCPNLSAVQGVSVPDLDLTDPGSKGALLDALDESTAVVICAAVKRQFGDTIEAYRKNVAIVEHVAEAAAERSVARVAFMSSAAVYGEETHNTEISEKTPVNPTSYYGIAKFTGECLLKKAFSGSGKPSLVCFRPPLVYGPGDRGRTYGPAGFSAALRAGELITLWGDGSELREFLYVDDLCRMICHLTLGTFEGSVNLVSGQSYCFTDVIDILRTVSGVDIEINQRERSKNKVDNAFDATMVRSLLPSDFAPTALMDGIRRTFDSTK